MIYNVLNVNLFLYDLFRKIAYNVQFEELNHKESDIIPYINHHKKWRSIFENDLGKR